MARELSRVLATMHVCSESSLLFQLFAITAVGASALWSPGKEKDKDADAR